MEEDKDFIDFEFNGHWASEFKLLAVSDGDRYTSPFYGSVSPNTSTLVGKVGVHKWKTQVGEKEFNIQIAYDDVDLGTLRKIKEWLNPFVIGKLVFKEEPYKYYWVSLSEDPQISFLPFRTEDLIVDGKSYKKGVYKGDFTLNFICVDNYGYSDWSSFDENFDYLVNEIKGENFITFDDGSDNNLILTKIEGGFAQETKSAIPYTNVEGNDLQLTDVENVDTQNWIIKGGHHQVQTDEEKTTVNGESISISDVDDSKPADIVIKGNHYQATRKGYNLIDIQNNNRIFMNLASDMKHENYENGILFNYDYDSDYAYHNSYRFAFIYYPFKKNKQYRLSWKTQNLGKTSQSLQYYLPELEQYLTFNNAFTPKNDTNWIAIYERPQNFVKGYKVAITDVMLTEGSEIKPYEQYGASPSPDYPSEIETVGSNINLFDKDNQDMFLNGLVPDNTGIIQVSNTDTTKNNYIVTIIIPCEPNQEYTVSRYLGGKAFYLYESDKKDLVVGDKITILKAIGDLGVIKQTITTTSTAKYIVLKIYNTYAIEPNTYNDLMSSVKIEKGTVATSWSPYGQGSVEIEVCNKNLYNFKNKASVATEIITNEEGWITATFDNSSGSSNKYMNYITENLKLKNSTQYAIIVEIKKVSGTGSLIVHSSLGSTGQFEGSKTYDFSQLSSNSKEVTLATTRSDLESINWGLRTYLKFKTGQSGSITFRISVVKDTTVTASNYIYIPHQSQTKVLPIQQEMLSGDYIADIEHHEWRKYVFTGEENYVKSSGYSDDKYFCGYTATGLPGLNMKAGSAACCTHFKRFGSYVNILNEECINITPQFHVRILASHLTENSAEAFKSWLKSQYEAGTPVTIYYKLAEPLNLELTSEQKAAREQIFNTKLYSGVTNIINRSSYPALLNLDYNITRQRPTLDWPSEVETVKDNVEIDVVNKNIMPIVNLGTSWEYTERGIKSFGKNKGTDITKFYIKKGQTIKIGLKLLSQSTVDTTFTWYVDNVPGIIPSFGRIQNLNLNQVYERSYTADKDCEIKGTRWGDEVSDIFEFQLWAEIDNLTNYIKHQSQTAIMPIQQEMLENDYVADVEHHEWGKVVFDGSENWVASTETEQYIQFMVRTESYVFDKIICNIFPAISTNERTNKSGCVLFNDEHLRISLLKNDYSVRTLEEFKQWLSENNLLVYCRLATPLNLELTPEQKTVMNKLNTLQFYPNITNLSLSNSVAKVNFDYNGYDGMPSPRYPSDLQVIKDSVDITISNKNLFDFNKLNTQNTNLTIQGNKLIGNNVPNIVIGTAPDSTALMKKTLLPGTYTVSFDITSESSSELINCYFCCQQADDTYNNYYNGKATILLPNEKNRVFYEYKITKPVQKIGIIGYLQGNANLEISNIAIIEGTDNKYTEYEEQVISMPVQQELFKDDYIEDVEHHEWKKIIVDGINYGAFYVFPNGRFVVANPSTSEVAGRDIVAIRDWAVSEPEHILCNYLPTVSVADQTQRNMLGITNGTTGEIVIKLDGSSEDNNTWTKETVNEYLQQQNEKGQPLTVWYKTTEPYDLELTEDQADIKENCKDFVYSYPGANYISANTTLPKLSISYMPEQDLAIDFVTDGSNLLNSSSFYYTNKIYLKSFKDKEMGNPDTSGITSSRAEYLFNAGNQPANLNLTFDYIPPQQGAPLEINIDKVQLTSNGWKTLEKKYTSISLEYFEAFKPFTDLLKKAYSIDDLSNLPSNWQNDWQLEINSEIKEIYFKNKHNKGLVISLNKFNKKQEFLQLCGSNFVDYSKPFPTLITEVEESAIADTYFNKVYLTATTQDYRLKNINLEWKHTYL